MVLVGALADDFILVGLHDFMTLGLHDLGFVGLHMSSSWVSLSSHTKFQLVSSCLTTIPAGGRVAGRVVRLTGTNAKLSPQLGFELGLGLSLNYSDGRWTDGRKSKIVLPQPAVLGFGLSLAIDGFNCCVIVLHYRLYLSKFFVLFLQQ